jgi:hypothetical protein
VDPTPSTYIATTCFRARLQACWCTGGFGHRREAPMGDKSPKSKQRGKDQKDAAKAQIKSTLEKRQQESISSLNKEKKK